MPYTDQLKGLPVTFPLSIASSHSSVIKDSAVWQECLLWKPDCLGFRRLWSFKNAYSDNATCFSSIFDTTGKNDIGL